MTTHARLSGSSSHRWINCPGSVRLIEGAGRSDGGSSSYAREGTMAHAVAAHILTTNQVPAVGSTFEYEDHGEQLAAEITDTLLENIDVYVREIRRHVRDGGILRVERHVDLSALVREEMFGTADAAIVKPRGRELVVADFKYGYTPVRLVDHDMLLEGGLLGHVNSQLLYYAAGVAHAVGWDTLDRVVLQIIQPRCPEVESIQETAVSPAGLKSWAENDLWAAAHAATSENAPLIAGDWCRFCPALDHCPEARKTVQSLANADFADIPAGPEIPENVARLAEILKWADIVDAWLRACEAQALELMRNGVKIAGHKLVEGKKNRVWPTEDPATLAKLLNGQLSKEHRVKPEVLTTRELVSPARAEKIVGKIAVRAVAIRPEGDLTIAAESDRRPAVEPIGDFGELNI